MTSMVNFKKKNWLKLLSSENSSFWSRVADGEKLELFYSMSRLVPAFKKFLKHNKIRTGEIRGPKDLINIPPISKHNYFLKYGLVEAEWPGEKMSGQTLTATSGSTGKPVFFSRNTRLDYQYSVIAEYFLSFRKGTTLVVDCFGMGVWIGGLITYSAFHMAGQRGCPVTVITPGISKKDIFNCLIQLSPEYDNVILTGYPPFIKDIIDDEQFKQVNTKRTRFRLLFAAESFTESFRDYICKHAGIKEPMKDTMNIYGSAELGAMAFETPTCILSRNIILKNDFLRETLFPEGRIPTIAQYIPYFVNFEEFQNRVLITGNNVSPMFKYDIGDNGNTFTFAHFKQLCNAQNIDIFAEAKKHNISIEQMPFVTVFERADFSTTLYGLQVYPQHIKIGLERLSNQSLLTGRFRLKTKVDKFHNQYLELNLELKKNVRPIAKSKTDIQDSVVKALSELNSEFRELSKSISNSRVKPKIIFWPYGHELYFKTGIKQKWSSKE